MDLKLAIGQIREMKNDDDLSILRNARILALGNDGESSEPAREFKAYLSAAVKGSAVREQLIDIADKGSPAGRIYAASLLYAVDRDLGLKKLKQLQSSTETVDFQSGCTVKTQIVGNIARSLVTEGRFLQFTIGSR